MKEKETIYASVNFSKRATKKIRSVIKKHKKKKVRITIENAANKLIEESK